MSIKLESIIWGNVADIESRNELLVAVRKLEALEVEKAALCAAAAEALNNCVLYDSECACCMGDCDHIGHTIEEHPETCRVKALSAVVYDRRQKG